MALNRGQIEVLPMGKALPLFARVHRHGDGSWRLMGTIVRSAGSDGEGVRASFLGEADVCRPAWFWALRPSSDRQEQSLDEIEFGVRLGDGSVRVVASGPVTREVLVESRWIARGLRGNGNGLSQGGLSLMKVPCGMGPRAPRSSWPGV